jgi:hypothetical protein
VAGEIPALNISLNRLDASPGAETLIGRFIITGDAAIGITAMLEKALIGSDAGVGLEGGGIYKAVASEDSGTSGEVIVGFIIVAAGEAAASEERIRARIMTFPGNADIRPGASPGRTVIPHKGANR